MITLEKLRAVIGGHLSKIVFQGSKAGDMFYYACKDFMKAGGGEEELAKPSNMPDDEEDKEEVEPRQRLLVRFQSQVL